MDINLLRQIVTVVAFATFVGIVLWAWSARNGKRFEQAARMALDDDMTLSPALSQGRGRSHE
jgi:cytochrome c oxidase cbb3-type subunit 4